MIITRTPYRFSLYGGGLDYPAWYKRNSSRILCAGLDYYCYQTVRKLPPFFNHRYRAAYSKIETTKTIDEIMHPSVREVFRKYGKEASLEVAHVGDLPSRSGIGSSSAFTVGLINSLTGLQGKYMGREELARAAIDIEQQEMGEKVGIQDQCAAAFGGLLLIEADSESINPRKFISRKEYINYICDNMLLGFDGIERYSGESSEKITRKIEGQENDSILNELAVISNEGINVFGKEGDINQHAYLTKQSRDLKISLNPQGNNERTQQLIEATERAGSLCTRVMGAGGGGFFVCWAPKYRHDEIKTSVKVRTWVDVKFSKTGSQVIFAE